MDVSADSVVFTNVVTSFINSDPCLTACMSVRIVMNAMKPGTSFS